MKRIRGITAGLAVLLTASALWGQIPKVITYQGLLKDNNGDIVADGNYDLRFQLFDGDDPSTSTSLWSEEHLATGGAAVAVTGGLFTVQLGNIGPLDILDFDEPYWLEIAVWNAGTWDAMLPLVPLTSVPYALRADVAEQATVADSATVAGEVKGLTNFFAPQGKIHIGSVSSTSPDYNLEIVSDSAMGLALIDSTTRDFRATLVYFPSFGSLLNLKDNANTSGARIRGFANSLGEQAFFSAGHVGFGTKSPLARIHAVPYDPTGVMLRLENNLAGGRIFDFAVGATGSDINLVPPGGFSIIDVTTGTARLTIDAAGSVGIGTNTPSAKLHIVGTAGTDGIRFPDNTLQTTAATSGLWSSSGSDINYTAGNVGIGTTTPTRALQILTPTTDGVEVTRAADNITTANLLNAFYGGILNLSDSLGTRTSAIRGYAGTNGVQAFFTAGNVGIGTESPTALLEIGGTAGVDGIKFPDGTLQTSASSSPWVASGGDISYTAGRVGVGTANPPYKFYVQDSTATPAALIKNLHTSGTGLEIAVWDTSGTGNPLRITAGTSTLLRMTNKGRLGIGDLQSYQPSYKLHVRDTVANYNYAFGAESKAKTSSNTGANAIYAFADGYNAGTSSVIGIYTQATGGSSGGTTYGAYANAFAYGTSTAYGVRSTAGGSTTGRKWAFYGNGDQYLSGQMAIGNINPSSTYKLYVEGNSFAAGNLGLGGYNASYRLYASGNIWVTGTAYALAHTTTSDMRLKKNITPLQGALNKILQLRGVSFEWRKDEYPERAFDDGSHIGFIAQEVEEILPELVLTDEKGYKSLAYANLTAVLVEAIKELKAENDALKATLAGQTTRGAELEARLDRLENLLESLVSGDLASHE